ncbi:MAG: hypothetical protein JW782_06505 [Candidatus Saganbacteria bacterium]|nr:hypothetical protein [Candidatus Saganbacteria bacterium]
MPACPDLRNPTPEASDAVSTMEGRVIISGSAVRTLNMNITVKATDEYGAPTGATGSGSIEVGGVTLDTTMEVTFTSGGTNESLSLTGTSSNNYSVTITMAADGSGSGTVKDDTGATLATIDITAAGVVTVTDSAGNTETFNI